MKPKPTFAEVFQILSRIESVPLEECKVAFDRFAASSPKCQMDAVLGEASQAVSTQQMLIETWPDMDPERYPMEYYEHFALAYEYAFRITHQTEPNK